MPKVRFEGGSLDGVELDLPWRALNAELKHPASQQIPVDAQPTDHVVVEYEWYDLQVYTFGPPMVEVSRYLGDPGTGRRVVVEVPNPQYREVYRYTLRVPVD